MFTKLDIINQVLNEISSASTDNVNDNDAALIISNKLDILLPELLCETDWNFATKYVDNNTPLVTDFSPQYRYSYALPPDFGRFDRFYNFSTYGAWGGLPWRIVDGQLLTNQRPIQYYYVVNNCAYGVLPPKFARALIMYCAAEVAAQLTENLIFLETLNGKSDQKIAEAVVFNDQERPIARVPYNDFDRPSIV